MIEIDKIYNEDCLEGMKAIDDGVVDFVLTDLPYGITDCPFDIKIDLAKFWAQINRVTKHNAAIALFSQMPFGAELIMSNRKMFRYEWIWHKPMPTGFLNANRMPMRCHENILVFYQQLPLYNAQMTEGKPYKKRKVPPSYNYDWRSVDPNLRKDNDGKRYPRDVVTFNSIYGLTKVYHAQQKPVDLLEYLIRTYTNEGELVLDATIGSGSTAVAAVNTGRHFIGFETEEKFYNIANERIAKAQAEKAQALF